MWISLNFERKRFQFTHPGRGATVLVIVLLSAIKFQFTHPGRGATPHRAGDGNTQTCFNSRTPGGVRHIDPPHPLLWYLRFNSRTPGGVRQEHVDIGREELEVSIHAPREGCDCESLHFVARVYVSIHAPREGCDILRWICPSSISSFNSRTPGGVRHHRGCSWDREEASFNSRTPGGVRLQIV